eukprot:3229295-Amphidinium_carterae.4
MGATEALAVYARLPKLGQALWKRPSCFEENRNRQTDGRTDRQTDRQADRQTDRPQPLPGSCKSLEVHRAGQDDYNYDAKYQFLSFTRRRPHFVLIDTPGANMGMSFKLHRKVKTTKADIITL